MTEKLKYKVGDKVLVEAVIADVLCDSAFPYMLDTTDGTPLTYVNENFFDKPSVRPLSKPKILQAVLEYYLKHKDKNWSIEEYLDIRNTPDEIDDWLFFTEDKLKNQHALATLVAYGPQAVEVEKEKKYRVMLKRISQILCKQGDSLIFTLPNPFDEEDGKYLFTKQELIEAGFEGVFDNPMFEVEEVE